MPRRQARGIVIPRRAPQGRIILPRGGDGVTATERQLLMCLSPVGHTDGLAYDTQTNDSESPRAGGATASVTTLYDSTFGWHAEHLMCTAGGTVNKFGGNYYGFAPDIVNLLEADRSGYVLTRPPWKSLELEGYCALETDMTAAPTTHPAYAYWGWIGTSTRTGSFVIDTWTNNNMGVASVAFFAHPGGNWYAVISKFPLNAYPTDVFAKFTDTGVAWDGYVRHLSIIVHQSGPAVAWKIDGQAVASYIGTLPSGWHFDNENSPADFGILAPSFCGFRAALNDSLDMWVHMGGGTRLWLEE